MEHLKIIFPSTEIVDNHTTSYQETEFFLLKERSSMNKPLIGNVRFKLLATKFVEPDSHYSLTRNNPLSERDKQMNQRM